VPAPSANWNPPPRAIVGEWRHSGILLGHARAVGHDAHFQSTAAMLPLPSTVAPLRSAGST